MVETFDMVDHRMELALDLGKTLSCQYDDWSERNRLGVKIKANGGLAADDNGLYVQFSCTERT